MAPRADFAWLAGTYWYCAAACMPALRTLPGNRFERVIDQTVWSITGYADGYFWGVASALVTPAGSEPDPSTKSDMTFFASVTPQGQAHVTFVLGDGSTTIGTGSVTDGGEPRFEMQMSSGSGPVLVVHWAYMLRITPDDPQWHRLPGGARQDSCRLNFKQLRRYYGICTEVLMKPSGALAARGSA